MNSVKEKEYKREEKEEEERERGGEKKSRNIIQSGNYISI